MTYRRSYLAAFAALFISSLLATPLLAGGTSEARAPGPLSVVDLVVCHNFGCTAQSPLSLTRERFTGVMAVFEPAPSNPREERAQIRAAIAEFERLAGEDLPTYRDKGLNPNSTDAETPQVPAHETVVTLVPPRHYASIEGQMDCIDESTNTTTYLRLLEKFGLLTFHRVKERTLRTPGLFRQHWAATIEEIDGGAVYAVDSWFLDNGEPPYIQHLAAWKSGTSLPVDGLE
ncbi:MAG: hypothetical protein HOO00_08150 [Rhodospirillaceae bacterium]|jgi:hypothetical protein|nr:hypothetical protein [Rhodospirillaceae bacterium]MBT5752804.1 hypothetical protein [Rhodospirillaceae bacterium]